MKRAIGVNAVVIAVGIEDVAKMVGLSRTRIFGAVRSGELVARKAGRSTIVEVEEVSRWVKALPFTKCNQLAKQEGIDDE